MLAQGADGDAPHAVPCEPGLNARWLLRPFARLGLAGTLPSLFRRRAGLVEA